MSKLILNGEEYINKYNKELIKYKNGPDILKNTIFVNNTCYNNWNIIKLELYLSPTIYFRNKLFISNLNNKENLAISITFSNNLDLSKIKLEQNILIFDLSNTLNRFYKNNSYTSILPNLKVVFELSDISRLKTEKFLIKLAEINNNNEINHQ